MDAAELFEACLGVATGVVRQVRQEQLANGTPDSEWNVKDLANHMLNELSWVPDLVEGKAIAEVGDAYDGDLVGDNAAELAENWQVAADKAETAVAAADPDESAHLSYGDVPNAEYVRQVSADLLIHAWDLGQAISAPVTFDIGVAQAVYDDSLPQESMLRGSGLFGDKVAVSDSADLQTKLLALYGRRADWQASK